MEYYCDNQRHLVCYPYSIENLHLMAKDLNIKRCWFHKNHYDIPIRRIQEIQSKTKLVAPKIILSIIKGKYMLETLFELRMYFFVPHQLTGIQQAIQAGHSMGEYLLKYGRHNPDHKCWTFLEKWKTWIVLNGGTTNQTRIEDEWKHIIPIGSVDKIAYDLAHADIEFATFNEPDLNDALTAVAFIADVRVFDYETYPDFPDFMKPRLDKMKYLELFKNGPWTRENIAQTYSSDVREWVASLGGEKNVFLRDLIKYKKLA